MTPFVWDLTHRDDTPDFLLSLAIFHQASYANMPKVSAEHLESRRTEILEAAWRCFGRKGFHQTTMRDICAEARLSPGAVYQYFAGKEDLIRSVALEGRKAGAARMVVPEGDENDGRRTLIIAVHRFLSCLTDASAHPSMQVDIRLAGEAVKPGPVRDVVIENYGDLISGFAEFIEQAQEDGSVAAGLPPRAVARVLLAIFQGLEFQKVIDPSTRIDECMVVVEALLDGRITGAP